MNQTLGQVQGNTKLARWLLWSALYVNVGLLCAICSLSMTSPGWLYSLLLVATVDFSVCYYAINQGLWFELQKERTWKSVCAGIGFTAVGRSFRNGIKGAYLDGDTKTICPKLRNVHGTHEAWTGQVMPFNGQVVADYTKEADAFAEAFHVPHVSFARADNGLITIRAGKVPVPEAYEYKPQAVAHYAASLRTEDVSKIFDAAAVLQAVPMAVDMNGTTWTMPVAGQHVLVAGRTGSGKNSWGWTLVFGLEQAIAAGICRIWAMDPKKVELSYGKHWFYKYANDQSGMVALIEEFLHEMQARGDEMEGVARKFTPSVATPLNILMIDELAYLTALLPDKRLRDRGMDALTTILTQGRAIGYSVLGLIQDPRKSTLPNRDSFTIRVALGLPEKEIIDMVLGDDAHEKGALCEQLPIGEEGAGAGYVMSQERHEPLLLRAPWVSDAAIKRKLGVAPDTQLETPALEFDYPQYAQGYQGYVQQLGFDGQPLDQ